MATYTINKSDGTTLVTVPEATINTSACSLALVGRRAVSYGELMAENFVHLAENFANSVAPASPLTGQLWFDTSAKTLKIYNNAQWNNLFNVTSGASTVTSGQFISTATTGTPPFVVSSTTKVTNLNADFVDGFSTDQASSANTIAVRDGNADLWAGVFHGVATSARYADVAERFEASEALEPGDVVEIGGAKEIEKARGASVLGVVSTQPGFRMNDEVGTDETHPFVAFCGRVPCKVTGPAAKGDRLVSNGDGTARVNNAATMNVIGRALEDKADDAVGAITIVVGVN